MKKFICCLSLCFLSISIFAVDLSSIKIGDTKTSLVKQYGTPFKEIKNGKFEYDVWLDKKDIWLCSFENEKVATEPMLLDDFLNSLLELSNAFSALGDLSFSDTTDSSTSAATSSESSSKTKTESDVKIDKSLLKSIDITILECCIINKDYNPKAGYRLKVKNNGTKEITNLKVVLYFYDKKGKIFFEDSCTLIDSDSYSKPKNLKPNYSVLIPESSSTYYTVQGMDLDEWDEGKVSFEVIELK